MPHEQPEAEWKVPPRALPARPPALAVPAMGDAELDGLPFGVIALDREGRVLRYNLAESRFARLDRAQVLGRDFFRRVAPCTATPAFEGRVRAFFAGAQPVDRFSYLFDFKFGAQDVQVELVRVPANDRVYLLIDRQRFGGARPGLPAGFAAPLQQELAPDEKDLGVQRDASARRVVTVDQHLFTALHQTWLKVAPRAWPGFAREWGWQWGRHAVVDLEADLLEERGLTLREVSMRDAMAHVSHWGVARGLGTLRFDYRLADEGLVAVTLERSVLGEAVGSSPVPRCHLIEGLLEAVVEHLAQRLLCVRELSCCAQGHEACSFVVVSEARRAAVEAELARGVASIAALAEVLRAGR
jgi:photoactive yellow protein